MWSQMTTMWFWQRSWPWKVKVIINGTIRSLDLKNIDLDAKIVILSALVQKFWSKSNITRLCSSQLKPCTIFLLVWRPWPELSWVEISWWFFKCKNILSSLYKCYLQVHYIFHHFAETTFWSFGHNFWTEAARMMILVSWTMFFWAKESDGTIHFVLYLTILNL